MSELLSAIRAGRKPVVGMVQLGALPGGSRYMRGPIDAILQSALGEAGTLAENDVEALMVQNLGDLPVASSATSAQVAWMTRIVAEIRERFKRPVGLNLLENDAEAMFAIASAAGADFVRIKVYVGAMMTPFGIESAQAFAAIRARNACDAANVAIFADVHDRTGAPIASGGFAEDLDYAIRLGGADGLVLTGKSYEQTLEFVHIARKRLGDVPILVGGGVSAKNFAEVISVAEGAIVSSSLKDADGPFGRFVPAKVQAFMEEAKRVRSPS
ncbi:MAG TPA: BtpA/SgcQ family protein [Roseiarcus sp.]|nr:BtpA/SgcQ family protein [Roseiarcus sp.]